MQILKAVGLFILTALVEILGCYLPNLYLKKGSSVLILIPALASLVLFSWLLTLHPAASGRVYAAYGGIYVVVALVWLRVVDDVTLTRWDVTGGAIAVAGMLVIVWGGWRGHP